MPKRLFVGNLPFSTTEDELNNLFKEIGQVESIAIITNRYSGRSRGFGFVEMTDDAEAAKAIEQLNGQIIEEREIVVNEAKPREEHRESRDRNSRS
jgi:RNA recognition motif-containing protein